MSGPSKHEAPADGAETKELVALTKGILTDVTLCIGCERCVEACTRVNKLPRNAPAFFKAEDGLSADRYTSIVEIDGPAVPVEGKPEWRTVRRQCMHCIEPSCVNACLVGAFEKRADGPVVYDSAKCIGCRYCMLACPFMIPRYEYDELLPLMTKCKMSEECRVEGGMPGCVSVCPTEATIFGPREKLLEEAHRRIEAEPGRYIDHVWGEHEFGGTHVIYISDVPLNDTLRIPTEEGFEKLRVAKLAHESIPHLVHTWVIVTPIQFFAVGTVLSGIWFFNRKAEVAAAEGNHGHGHGGEG